MRVCAFVVCAIVMLGFSLPTRAAYYGILTTAIDNSAFTPGTTQGFNSNCYYNASQTANQLASGNSGTFGCNANRAEWVDLTNQAGAEIGTPAAPLYVSVASTVPQQIINPKETFSFGQLNVSASQSGTAPWNIQYAPNLNPACPNKITVNQTASTDLYTSRQHIYICSIALVVAGQEQVSLVEGTGTTCGTGTLALMGSTTAGSSNGMPFAANGGMVGWADTPVMTTQTVGDHLCLLKSSTNLLSGVITYADRL